MEPRKYYSHGLIWQQIKSCLDNNASQSMRFSFAACVRRVSRALEAFHLQHHLSDFLDFCLIGKSFIRGPVEGPSRGSRHMSRKPAA
jgi:hypothetical protein